MVSWLHRIIHEVIVSEYARRAGRAIAAAVTDFIARRTSRTRRRLDIAPRELHFGPPTLSALVFARPGETRLYALPRFLPSSMTYDRA